MSNKNEIGNPEMLIDNLPEAIEKLATALKKLTDSRLREDTIVLLLHDKTKISKRDIKIILGAMDRLEEVYLKPKKK